MRSINAINDFILSILNEIIAGTHSNNQKSDGITNATKCSSNGTQQQSGMVHVGTTFQHLPESSGIFNTLQGESESQNI